MGLRIPFVSRRVSGDKDKQDTHPAPAPLPTPDWVTTFRLWGVPLSAVSVLVLCAPGEQHIAELSGWHGWISWGLAGLFTLYAGLASVISTQLPRGARGKASSIVGAVISLALAMAAQPVSHMFVTGYLSAEPRPPLWLVATVSSVPPFILGHLLHFAAMPTGQRTARKDKVSRKDKAAVPAPVPASAAVSSPKRTTSSVTAPQSSPAVPGTVSPAPAPKVSLVRPAVPVSVPVDELSRLRSLTEVVRALRAAGHSRDEIKAIVPTVPGYEGTKDNSLNKALARTA